jgi:polysaccharide export outer membrane protein
MRILSQFLVSLALLAPSVALAQVPAAGAMDTGSVAARGALFQIGDRVQLMVEGDTALTGTFTVVAGPSLTLPVIGSIPLTGVRRADVQSYLTTQLSLYLKRPVVHAQTLIHLSLIGEVEHPGYYSVAVDMLLGDVLMQAGGPTREADIHQMSIKRNGQLLYQADTLRKNMTAGMTVDQLGLRDGDNINVPKLVRKDPESAWRIVGIVVMSAVAIITITRWH